MSVLKITGANFVEEVLNAKEPVLIDFWAAWCRRLWMRLRRNFTE